MSTTRQPTTGSDIPTEITGDAVDPDGPFSGPFWQEVSKRRKQGRDIKIIITAEDGATGVGKTSLAVFMAKALDLTDGGFTADKSTVDLQEFMSLYQNVEPRSAVIFDEAEQLDARRSMRNENVDAARKWETMRVKEIAGILTLPSPQALDSRMEALADYWINVECRGTARIYAKRIHRIKQQLYYETLQQQRWPNLDNDEDYQALAEKKDELIDDPEADDNWVRQSKVRERVEKAKQNMEKQARNDWICALKSAGMAGTEIQTLPHIDIQVARLNEIAREHTPSYEQ